MHKITSKRGVYVAGLMLLDIIAAITAVYLSLVIRFKFEMGAIPVAYLNNVVALLPLFCVCLILIFCFFRLYRSLWEYASLGEAGMLFLACMTGSIFYVALAGIFEKSLPKSCYFLIFALLTMEITAIRFLYRFTRLLRAQYINHRAEGKATTSRIMIIGAGVAARTLITEINNDIHLSHSKVVCVIDDAQPKQEQYFCGVLVVGGREAIKEATVQYQVDEIIFAIPSADLQTRRALIEICKETTCTLKTLPGVYQLVNGEVSLDKVRKVEIADLLGRESIKLDTAAISCYIKGKTVLVTGAGGSIGSELCMQIAGFEPKRLVLFDIYENNVYYIQRDLRKLYPTLRMEVLIGSVRDVERLEYVFSTYRPEVVYHAAAHKHVPLMEDSPNEAIKNNVFGTLNVVRAADRYQVLRFVMISTDKAVNPTNIMGATKRMCEMIIQTYNQRSQTEYVAVRFGNVLGSNGSVIPIFKKQIEEGGPVTVTHPEVIRYFMTIPEAVSLVLQAGAFAKGGEIFVLDMGEPVRILTLAENMIRLSGKVPYKDIDIQFTGLRPGEKLFEELLMDDEGLMDTENSQIHVGHPMDLDSAWFYRKLKELHAAARDEHRDIRTLVREIVDTYHTPEEVNALEEESENRPIFAGTVV